MAIYDGVVTLSDSDVPVMVELGENTIRLSASGTEIGEWSTDDCDITRQDASTYLIHAEAETLPFTPHQPGAFAAAVGLADLAATVPLAPVPTSQVVVAEVEPATIVNHPVEPGEVPSPQPITMGFFYGLSTLTLGLAIWALISIVF